MNTLFTSALALATLGTITHATPDPKPEPAVTFNITDSDWDRLDSEINSLATSVRRPSTGTNVGGLLRTYYSRSNSAAFELDNTDDSIDNGVASGTDLDGFDLKEAEVYAEGSVAEYDWRVNFDYRDDTVLLEDAFARWNYGNGINIVIGQFKAPILRSSGISSENLLLPDRTFAGQIFDFYDAGVMLTADLNSVGGFFAIQNGEGGEREGLLYSGRAEYRLFGGTGRLEGAFGSSGDVRATVGAMMLKDSTDGVNGTAWGGDVNVTAGPVALHAEVVHFAGELLADPNAVTGPPGGPMGNLNGTSRISGNNLFGGTMIPINFAENGSVENVLMWSSTLSFMIEAIDVELGVRVEGYDDPGDTRSATIGANWYRSGKNVVWHAGVTQLNSNNSGSINSEGNTGSEGLGDATLFQVGLSVGMHTSSL
ncbi:MAG: hypothetical protein ACI8TQ_003853 [Planctomycetota bacterium]|jgi:hypothetical protein